MKVSHLDEHNSLLARNMHAAEAIVPLLLKWLAIGSVLDVGCGTGLWMKVFAHDAGADVVGIDVEEFPESQLLVEKSRILNLDIGFPFDLRRRFDLVLCLETAEHIETEHSCVIVESLTRHGDVVLFSAALPGQIGLHHVNEQLPEFWIERFARSGFNLHDLLRPRIWGDRRIPEWYRQNMLVFSRNGSEQDERLRCLPAPRLVSVAHPDLLQSHGTEVVRLSAAAKATKARELALESDVIKLQNAERAKSAEIEMLRAEIHERDHRFGELRESTQQLREEVARLYSQQEGLMSQAASAAAELQKMREHLSQRVGQLEHSARELLSARGQAERLRRANALQLDRIQSQQTRLNELRADSVRAARKEGLIRSAAEQEIHSITAQRNKTFTQIDEIKRQRVAAVVEAEALRKVVEAASRSVSWRISRPMRAAGRVARMLAGKPWDETASLLTAAKLEQHISGLVGSTASTLHLSEPTAEGLSGVPSSRLAGCPSDAEFVLSRLPFFDPDEYLKVNPDVARNGMSAFDHYWNFGLAESRPFISSIGAARAIAHYNHCDDAIARFPYLSGADNVKIMSRKRLHIAVLTGSRGNYYMDEIADHVSHGLLDLGVAAVRGNENFEDIDAVDHVIVVAPHEFFHSETAKSWSKIETCPKLSILNTEQIQTTYFAKALPYIIRAKKVIELNYQLAAMLQDAGMDTFYYIPGYTESSDNYPELPDIPHHPLSSSLPKAVWDYSLNQDDFADRPIDVTFVSNESPIRNEFLARNAGFFASRLCQIVYRQRGVPMPAGLFTAEMPRLNSALGRRSKIVLNVHRDGIGYFEWARVVFQGIWQKAVVVSNPCLAHPMFKPGEHYFEESLGRIPKLMAWLLDTKEGRAEADRVRFSAFETLVQHCSLRASSLGLLSFLEDTDRSPPVRVDHG